MNMQDKEIDQLFRSQLEGFEVEPSPNVWPGITAKMDAGKKRPVILWLSIAASLLILLSAGLYFVQQNNIPTKKTEQIFSTNYKNPPKNTIAPKRNKKVENFIAEGVKIAKVAKVKMQKREWVKSSFQPAEDTAPIAKTAPINTDEQLAQLQPHREVLRAVVPDVETPLSIRTDIKEDIDDVIPPVNTVVQLSHGQDNKIITAAAPAKKRRIRSIGDMLNAVISKVDKRKDKIIEFTNTDEDESTITGVNFGIVRIKKQQ